MTAPPPAESFRDIFCAQYGVPLDRYDATVLRLTLYPHARWLADLSPAALFRPDRVFVSSVGALTRWRGFGAEVHEFQHVPENRQFWRRRLRLRISVARMRELFSEVMGGTASPATSQASRPEEIRSRPGSWAVD